MNFSANIQYSIAAIIALAIGQATIEIPLLGFLGTGFVFFYHDRKGNDEMASGLHAWAAGFGAPALLMLPYGLVGKAIEYTRA